ncbi:MAG TPA: hypothetical protein VLM85_04760 [Polyangiaceae bacterium]|nr:hypothetical protein [Polyangiaceae bacterium]
MSSPVHTGRCLRREGRVVEVELGPTTAAGVHFPVSRAFALALLHEAATCTMFSQPGVPWPRRAAPPPLESALTFAEVLAMSSIERQDFEKERTVDQFVASAQYVATRNWTPSLWRRDARGAFVDPGVSRTDPRALAVHQALDTLYDDVAERADACDDPDQRARLEREQAPHATLRIETTEPRWCAHLEAAMIWDVYAFDYGAADLL